MGEARKDRQLRMDAVLLEIFLQALHTGYAVIAIRGVADKLVVELADTDEDGYLLYGFEVDIITEVILEITDTPEVVLVWIQEGRTSVHQSLSSPERRSRRRQKCTRRDFFARI